LSLHLRLHSCSDDSKQATCESGVQALPLEVVNYFSPQVETSSGMSSLYPVQVCPCVTVEFTSCHDPKGLLERASQDVARALAAGFASRIARLREAYIAGCSAEKPKLNTTAGVRLSTSVQQIIADKVSQIRTRVREDLGRDLRNIGEDWARNLGGAPYANDLAKVFGIDVGRGLGLDLGLEFKDLESGLVEEVNKECGVNVEERIRGGVEIGDMGASCMIRGRNIEQDFVDISDHEHQKSTQRKGTGFVISGNRSLDFNGIDGSANESIRKTLPLQGTDIYHFNFKTFFNAHLYCRDCPRLARMCATCLRIKVISLVNNTIYFILLHTHRCVCNCECDERYSKSSVINGRRAVGRADYFRFVGYYKGRGP